MTNRLTAAVVVKDEARYLPQWIEFHEAVHGFDKFVVYNNGSCIDQDPAHVLDPYGSLVEVINVPCGMRNKAAGWYGLGNMQYLDCEWCWAASVDEYFFSPSGEKLTDILKGFETTAIAALSVNWLFFNSDGPTDTGLVIERFTHCAHDVNEHVKSIGRQGNYLYWRDPHCVEPLSSTVSVNELHHHQRGPWSPEFTALRIVIHHYHTMSREEYDVKMNKGRTDLPGMEDTRRPGAEENWNTNHTGPHEDNRSLVQYAPMVRQRLLSRYKLI